MNFKLASKQSLLASTPCKATRCRLQNHRRTISMAAASSASLPGATVTVDLSDLRSDGGPPRVSSILPTPLTGSLEERSELPFMIYLPGIDGTGLAAARQFPSLLERFDLVTLVTPAEDRTSFQDLVDIVVAYLKDDVPKMSPTRPVYILGESFGGVLACAVAAACPQYVDRLILVNPATSYESTIWPLIGPFLPNMPKEAYSLLPIALAPVLGNPINLLSAALDGSEDNASAGDRISALVKGAAQLLSQLPLLANLLPPDTLAWKLSLLEEGCKAVAPTLSTISQRTLIVVGDQDLLIPSRDEGPRLQRELPRAHLRVERGRSHALLQEGGVDLVRILEEEGCLINERVMSAPIKKRENGAGFGSANPIELPTPKEVTRYGERTTALGRRLTSPVFISTDMDGSMAFGLDNIPLDGPTLLVGNHQTLALDLGVLNETFLQERRKMLRGLAHPVIFSSAFNKDDDSNKDGDDTTKAKKNNSGSLAPWDVIPAMGAALRGGGGSSRSSSSGNNGNGRQAFADFMMEFGAVPVSAKNMLKLLQNGETVLLFPGGVREAYKRQNEEYQLFWPEKSEFVRMAAKFNATIIPFAAVGVDDGLQMIADSEALKRAPIVGQMVTQNAASLPQARKGVSASAEEESFIAPLVVPKLPPTRLYFMFMKPIKTSRKDVDDRDRCDELYQQAKASVNDGLQYLLRKRQKDPYRDFGTRMLYETLRPGQKAPTFEL